MEALEKYVRAFTTLRSDRSANWPDTTLNRSPYKPLLLLSLIDQFTQGSMTTNLVELTTDLAESFDLYCRQVMPPDWRCSIAMPFFHLGGEGFWHLVPLPGKESIVASGRRLRSISLLTRTVRGAQLDDALYTLMCVPEYRDTLRAALIKTHFCAEAQHRLVEQSTANSQAFEYSELLLGRARQATREVVEEEREYQSSVRDQGFRRAIVSAYDHRCALCGIRMLTPGGHTAVVAAHIVPWSISQNDDPRNGMALCHLCHWAFDAGLVGVSTDYLVMTSPHLSTSRNMPGHLATLRGRGMIGPSEQVLWPDDGSLKWHLREVFLKR
jgi:putative restriction endonuclease